MVVITFHGFFFRGNLRCLSRTGNNHLITLIDNRVSVGIKTFRRSDVRNFAGVKISLRYGVCSRTGECLSRLQFGAGAGDRSRICIRVDDVDIGYGYITGILNINQIIDQLSHSSEP